MRAAALGLAFLGLPACSDDSGDAVDVPRSYDDLGPYAAAVTTFPLVDVERARSLLVSVWYPSTGPAVRAEAELAMDQLAIGWEGTYHELLVSAPADCPTRRLAAAPDAPPLPGPHPLIGFSHCLDCTRFSLGTAATHLASHGFVVVAPDHRDGTLEDHLRGTSVGLDAAFLPVRAADVRAALDAMLGDGAPPALRGLSDPSRVGVMGHSFGAVTAALVATQDPRIRALSPIAAPLTLPLLPGVQLDRLTMPTLVLVAVEDNSIQEVGNQLLRRDYAELPGPRWKAELQDAGHWSFSDLCGLIPDFLPGCGEAARQTSRVDVFTYLQPARGRALTGALLASFFSHALVGAPGARAALERPRDGVALEHGEP